MNAKPYLLDHRRREIVLESLGEICRRRKWNLLAAHVSADRVQVVISAGVSPERVMQQLKAYASQKLNAMGIDEGQPHRWAAQGSTLVLPSVKQVLDAVIHVVVNQGGPTAAWKARFPRPATPAREVARSARP